MKSTFFILAFALAACTPAQRQAEESIDHIILGINDLQKGIEQFKALTGVEPVFGGIHPNAFSQNALVALDGGVYIEILAPQPGADSIPDFIQELDSLTAIGWAVRTRDRSRTREKLSAIGLACTDDRPGSRAKPDGQMLVWSTFAITNAESFPFFIEWDAASVHPSQTSPAGCRLVGVSVGRPDPDKMDKMNQQLKLGLKITSSDSPALAFEIDSPRGKVTFNGWPLY
jgi:hypothetical protein